MGCAVRNQNVLTYGTYDLLHFGHMRLLSRAKKLGGRLIVGLSTDGFNAIKGKKAHESYQSRRTKLLQTGLVDFVFPEENWVQKAQDIQRLDADIFVMGDDWAGKFDELQAYCDVVYLSRTPGISSTLLRSHIAESRIAV